MANLKEIAKRLRNEGYSYKEIAQELNIGTTTVWRYLSDTNSSPIESVSPSTAELISNIQSPVGYVKEVPLTKRDKNLEDVRSFLENLRPIEFPEPTFPLVTQSTNPYAVVIGDTHFGTESQEVLDIFLQTIEELKPSTIILNGDTLDMFAISRYPKDVRHSYSLLDERTKYHTFLRQIHNIVGPNVKIYETNSNHSGNGNEGRWWRYLSDRIGELAVLPEIQEKLSYESVFLPSEKWSRLQLVDYVEVAPGFIVMHGDVVRRHGGYSARGLFEKWFTSIMCNHTHRVGMTAQRIPSIGAQDDRIVRVYENGCACSLKPVYASAANWQNAFSIINYSDKDVAVETVIVTNGRATSTTLGRTLHT